MTTTVSSHPSLIPKGARPQRICMHVLTVARTDMRVMREATALTRVGYSVSIVDIEMDSSRPTREVIDGVTLIHIRMPRRFDAFRSKLGLLVKATQMLVPGAFALARIRADVYHAHDITALPATYFSSLIHRRPLIFDAHELPLVEPFITSRPRLHMLAVYVLKLLLRRCAAVITVSSPLAQIFQQRYGGSKLTVVRNILPYSVPPAPNSKLHIALGLGAEERIAIYQGGMQENRGLDLLVRAGRYLAPHQHIVLMGDGPSWNELAALITHEDVAERVHLLPPVPYSELLDWTAGADIGLLAHDAAYSPNVRYCLPNKLFEYLMAGVPVLSTPLVAVHTMLEETGAGWVLPERSPQAMAAAINTLLTDPERRSAMRQSALAACRARLNWEHERERLTNLYDTLLVPNLYAQGVAAKGEIA